MNRLSEETGTDGTAILDRSRAQLRIPAGMSAECLRLAHVQSIPDVADIASNAPRAVTAERLEEAGILVDGSLDPVAFELLDVVNHASLVATIDLSYLGDSSSPSVWATPRAAVVSSSLDAGHVELRPVPVTQLPQVLAQLIVLRSPRFIGDVPISINTQILSEAERTADDRDAAIEMLTEGGLDADQAVLLLDLQRDDVRRWRISSKWSTDEGKETSDLRGIDAGPSGQWLVAMTDPSGNQGQMTFSPQGHGEVMSAFRSVLPKNWTGTPVIDLPTE